MKILNRWDIKKIGKKVLAPIVKSPIFDRPLPIGRISKPQYDYSYELLKGELKVVKPSFSLDLIPLIRQLSIVNPNLGLVINDIVQLSNTGHKILFDPSVTPEQVDAMRFELQEASKNWADGVAGVTGLINRMISQIYIGGALSNEWVINKKSDGVDYVALVNPETILTSYNPEGRYDFYQKVKNLLGLEEVIKLNKYTYKYFALNGDTELPQGIPPFIAALESISTERTMIKNINFIVEQIGLMGFLEILLAKPDLKTGESESDYQGRLTSLLTETKNNLKLGMDDGIMVGFKEDHEAEFHSTTKNISGLNDVFGLNENQIANGLKFPGSFLGAKSGLTETQITIVFTKVLSQLKNVHELLKYNLEFGYSLHLLLKGFKFKYLNVEFNPSTIADDLKIQQAQEIKIRNQRQLYMDGIISLETYADVMGKEKPDQTEPRVDMDPNAGQDVVDKQKEEKDKDTSDRRTRDKNKPQPKRRDRDTRPS
jgi:hypothetical protein